MELTQHGTIKVEDCTVRHTKEGRWMVSRSGILIGYSDTLGEVPALIAGQRDAIRARLARLNAEAAQRKAEAQATRASIDAATKPE